jgi:hypothetical protein
MRGPLDRMTQYPGYPWNDTSHRHSSDIRHRVVRRGVESLARCSRGGRAAPDPRRVWPGAERRRSAPSARPGDGAGPADRVITDAVGRYLLTSLPAGKVVVQARRIGFADKVDSVYVTPGAQVELDFVLWPLPNPLDDPVIVVPRDSGANRTRRP